MSHITDYLLKEDAEVYQALIMFEEDIVELQHRHRLQSEQQWLDEQAQQDLSELHWQQEQQLLN
jgi:hypothetical protein